MATKQIDLNCDMGESYGRWTLGADEEIMPFITSANVACGFHGGDPHVMRKMGVRTASEGFADRAYNVDLSLVSRKLPGSLITDPQKAADQAVRMALESKVKTIDGVDVDISVQTICCHGDTPGAQKIVRTVREALDRAGCQVKPLRDWLPRA